jgi:hypothetical protein
MIVADRSFGLSPASLLKVLVGEFRQLAQLNWTVGSINALGLLAVLLFGIFLYVAESVGSLQALLIDILGYQKSQEYTRSVSALTLFLALVTLSIVSVICVTISQRRNP